MRIRLVSIKEDFFNIFDFPTEIMTKEFGGDDRPFLVILRLKYKDETQSFALPFRSNIQVNKNTIGLYYPLPRRKTTKPNHVHGLHYIKMFPINIQYCNKFVLSESNYNKILVEYIEKNISKIVKESQEYLVKYEHGERPLFCTDIEKMVNAIKKYELLIKVLVSETQEQVAIDKE